MSEAHDHQHHQQQGPAGHHEHHQCVGTDDKREFVVFWFGSQMTNFLIYGLNVKGTAGIICACICMALIAILFDVVRTYRSVIREKLETRIFHRLKRHPEDSSLVWTLRLRGILVQSVMYFFQTTLGYVMMLAVMTYNVWIGLAVLLGATLGFFVLEPLTKPHPIAHVACESTNAGTRTTSVDESNGAPAQSGRRSSNPNVVDNEDSLVETYRAPDRRRDGSIRRSSRENSPSPRPSPNGRASRSSPRGRGRREIQTEAEINHPK